MEDGFSVEIERKYDGILRSLDGLNISGFELMRQLTQRYTEEKCLSSGKPFPTFLKPAFLSPAQMKQVRFVTDRIMSCLEKVSDLYYRGKEFLPRKVSMSSLANCPNSLSARPPFPMRIAFCDFRSTMIFAAIKSFPPARSLNVVINTVVA